MFFKNLIQRKVTVSILTLLVGVLAVYVYTQKNTDNIISSPSDIANGKIIIGRNYSISGFVVEHRKKENTFEISDGNKQITVKYDLNLIFPSVFSVGEDIVVKGMLINERILMANSVMILGESGNMYYSPTDVEYGKSPIKYNFNVGGVVEKNSIKYFEDEIAMQFVISDRDTQMKVRHNGKIPHSIAEGDGVIVRGKKNKNGIFMANRVIVSADKLAKLMENNPECASTCHIRENI